jgi:hypothetical protein
MHVRQQFYETFGIAGLPVDMILVAALTAFGRVLAERQWQPNLSQKSRS